nr:MAG TPA: hypothetical protein [Caudoviricetes sp.]
MDNYANIHILFKTPKYQGFRDFDIYTKTYTNMLLNLHFVVFYHKCTFL